MNTDSNSTAETRRIVETLYHCASISDIAGALALIDPDVVVYEPPFLPFGGAYRGAEGFGKAFGLAIKYVSLPQLRVQRLIVEGGYAFGVLHVPAVNGGDVIFAEEFVVRDGKVVEITLYYHDAASVPLRT